MGWFTRKKEQRDWLSDSWSLPQRTPLFTTAGPWVDTSTTLGLSTAGAAVKLISETIGEMPLKVYRGDKPEQEEARDSWQWFRLKEEPNDEQSGFDFWQDVTSSIETNGNAFIWKAIVRRPVKDEGDIQLIVVDPAQVTLRRDQNNRRYYEVRRNGRTERVQASQILHIRGWTITPGADLGVSLISLHRETIGAALAAREYQSRFYSNGTTLPGFIVTPGTPTQQAIDRLQLEWNQRHTGLENSHRPGILANGATWVGTGISMRDAQYIETQRFSSEEICRICRITPGMLGVLPTNGVQAPPEQDFDRFLQADLGPRMRRIEMALKRDPDLFPTGSDLFCEFLSAAVLKPSITSRSELYKTALQTGYMTANEVRALENLPPVKWGQEVQQTPVGGAPNTPPKAQMGADQ
jgi:HK97 family phage portal protein